MKKLKQLDSSWFTLFFAGLLLAAYYSGDAYLIKLAAGVYTFIGVALFICLIPIIHFSFNAEAMNDLIAVIVRSEDSADLLRFKYSTNRFINIPIFLHMCCGLLFIMKLDNIWVPISLLWIMLYHRIMYLIISTTTIRYLDVLDSKGLNKFNK